MKRFMAVTAAVIVAGCGASAQTADQAPVEFEVASVKPSPPPDGNGMTVGCAGGPGTPDPGMIRCSNVSLTFLVTMAYRTNYQQVTAPPWMESQMFNIDARVPHAATREQVAEMWQSLLIARFRLAVHHESKELSKFDLVVAKGGPKFKEAVEDPAPKDDAPSADRKPGPNKVDHEGFPELARPGMIGMNGKIRLYQPHMTMEQLARTISGQLGRPVTDSTGLTGKYDINLYWISETLRAAAPADAASSPSGPSLMEALASQLGLKLESRKGPVDFLVVDHAEKVPVER